MSWTNPPTKIAEARTALLASPTVQALLVAAGVTDPTLQAARFHYPAADPATDPLPLFMLNRGGESYSRATATGSFGDGEIEWALHVDASTPTGVVEGYIDIAYDLIAPQADGLFIVKATAQRASLPTAAMKATEDGGQVETGISFITIAGTMTWEG